MEKIGLDVLVIYSYSGVIPEDILGRL